MWTVSEKIVLEAVPDWVRPISFSLDSKPVHESISNLHGLLRDEQINPALKHSFLHGVVRLINVAGVQDFSNFSVSFDPSYQVVSFHKFVVYRDGETIDKLDFHRFKVAQREQNWNKGLYQGTLSVMALIEDLREGDVVEYAFSLIGDTPHFSGKLGTVFPVEFTSQKEKVFYRVVKEKGSPLQFFYSNPELEKRAFATDAEWSCLLEPGPAFVWEPNQPSNFLEIPRIEVSGFTDWQQVARMGRNLYPSCSHFAQVPEVKQLIQKWKEDSPFIETQILNAIRFVQDQVRYLGLEEGWKPTDPSIVLQRRFGDCKDKTYLLQSLLELLDVHSTPCLVHANFLPDCLPSPYQFNHVVLRIELGDRHFWVDATRFQEGGTLENLAPLCYEFALPLSENTNGLVALPSVFQKKNIVQTKFLLKDAPDAVMEVESLFYGAEANSLRRDVCERSLKDMTKDFERFYSRFFGSLNAIKPIEVVDDRTQNQILVKEAYRIKEIWKNFAEKQTGYLCPTALSKYLNLNLSIPRTTPMQIEHPLNIEETVRIHREMGEWTNYLPAVSFNHEAFSYSSSSVLEDPQTLAIKYTLQTHKGSIQPQQAEEFAETIDHLWRSSCWSFSLMPPSVQNLLPPFASFFSWGFVGLFCVLFFYIKFKKPLQRLTLEDSSEVHLSKEQLWKFFLDPEGFKWVEGSKITNIVRPAKLEVGSEIIIKTKYRSSKMKVFEIEEYKAISFEHHMQKSRERIFSEVTLSPISENKTRVIGRLHFDVVGKWFLRLFFSFIKRRYSKNFRALLAAAEKYTEK